MATISSFMPKVTALLPALSTKWLRWAGYSLFAVGSFMMFLYITFPYQRVQDLIESQLNATGKVRVEIGDLGPRIPAGLSASNVVLRFPPSKSEARSAAPVDVMDDGAAPADAPAAQEEGFERVVIDEVGVDVSLLSLIFGRQDIDFDVAGFEGNIEGNYVTHKTDGMSLDLELDELQMFKLPRVAAMLGVPINGKLSGTVEFEMPRNRINESKGKIDLRCEECSIGDNKAKLKLPGNPFLAQGITLPIVKLGQVVAKVNIKKGVASVDTFAMRSDDVEIDLEGSANLRQPIEYSSLQGFLRFKIGDALKSRAKQIPFDLLESGMASAKQPDGSFGLAISGMLGRPRTQMGGAGGGSPRF